MAVDGGLAGVPPMPSHVHADMEPEWNAVALDLQQRGLLADSMLGVLSTYVMALWTARQAQAAIAEHGALVKGAHGALKPNPAAGMLSKSQEAIARLAAELGITPASRSRKSLQPKESARDGAPTDLAI